MNILKAVKKVAFAPTSSDQLYHMMDEKVKIMNYKQLKKCNSMDNVFHPIYKNVIILFETRHHYGHWICLFQDGDIIEHFDSYAIKPDLEMNFVDDDFYKSYYNGETYLVKLLIKSGKKIRYNHHKLQKDGPVSTCGRHCVCRLLNRNLDENEYKNLVTRKGMDTDLFITFITMFLEL